MKIGFLYSRINVENKLLLDEIRKRNLEIEKIDDKEQIFELGKNNYDVDVILERCVNHSRALYSLRIFEGLGIPCVNTYKVADICGNKFSTTMALLDNNVSTPKTYIAFTPESALNAIEKMGYPCVLKPSIGSWGRLLSKINDREAAETVLEHKNILGTYHHSIFYIQEYIEKGQRDIRSFVVGDETICAIYRTSKHWITNTARGGTASNCPVTDELNELSLKAAEAVGGGVLAVDLMETNNGLTVTEVNYTMEFRNSIDTTGVNIPKKVIDYVVKVAKK
jgi:[lysine-biosynthesis-protein LysW]--L-2-aminoadipate ligase